ncbi:MULTISPECIES: FHA domain-containing protein [Mycobacteriaceae]|uniref:FHA domain-containing protein n=1 Tax=Mycolicibacterium mucogenicum DSM 44124 TaxID=1226753 RepID=A0A8H2JBE5_MYCMU|nr:MULTISPECIES: FHA domain-containing protein [Mycobacteriaceae]KAB7758043.1 peptide-binding protein [Mycolicibacterium mucogenicum DSM 44124]QPG71471.1 FHA domain-containing protein [Mycolicibacterium mucogenicum DSM 44124]
MSLTNDARLGDDVTVDATAAHRVIGAPAQGHAVRRRGSEVRPGSGVLVISRGPGSAGRFLLADDVVAAGRHPDSAVFLDDITVSRNHAEIRWLDDEYWIVDTGSLNGTYVNGTQVQSLPLTSGDEIQIGKFRLTFTCQPQDR